jgi:5-methylcytosine-specific restriction endonuclease McrA
MLDLHHIIPKGRIHLDIEDNLITLCRKCHIEVHDTPGRIDELILEWRMGNAI